MAGVEEKYPKSADELASEKPDRTINLDYQQTLFDGFLGFGLTMGNAVICFLHNAQHIAPSNTMLFFAFAALWPLVITAALLLCKNGSDWLQQSTGNRCVIGVVIVGTIASLACYLLGLYILGIIFPCLVMVATIVLFAGFLAWLPRKALIFIINIAFMYMGLAMLFFATNYQYGIVVLGVAALISLVFDVLFNLHYLEYNVVISSENSEKNNIKIRGNYTTLFLVGFMLGLVVLILTTAPSFTVGVLVMGAAVLVASLISLVMDKVNEKAYKDFMRKTMAMASCCLLLIPFLDTTFQLIVLGLYMTYVCMNLIIIINAIIETARFNLVSLVWMAGGEGSVLTIGMTCGAALAALIVILGATYGASIVGILLVIACFICAGIQIRVNYLIYPFEPVFEEKEAETTPEIETAGRHKALWQRKIDAACALYRLSPREIEVLHILLKGRDAKYIMDKFVVSQSTAKTHIYNIYRKFDIHSRQELLDFIEDMPVTDAPDTSKNSDE